MTTMRTLGVTAAVAAALLAPALAAAPAMARTTSHGAGRPAVQASGSCTQTGTWKLKAKPDNGALAVEFEVDTNVAGQAFNVRITDGSVVVFAGRATTTAPSGSFTVARRTADQPGRDTITALARRGADVCTGTIRI